MLVYQRVSLKSCFWACKASIRQLNDLGGERMLGNRKQDEINPRPDKDRQVEVADVLSNQFFNMFFWKKNWHVIRWDPPWTLPRRSAHRHLHPPALKSFHGFQDPDSCEKTSSKKMPHHESDSSAETSWVPVLGQGAASLLSQTHKIHRLSSSILWKILKILMLRGFWSLQFSDALPFRHIFPTTAPILASARVSAASVSPAAQLLSWRGPGEACSLPGINTPHPSHAVWWVLSVWVCCLMNVVRKVRRINIKWWSIV